MHSAASTPANAATPLPSPGQAVPAPAFASRLAGVASSPVRDILALTARPEVISFAGGLPAPELFDIAGIRAAYDRVLAEIPRQALQYSTTEGDPELRTAVADRLTDRGLPTDADDLLITTGSQQALDPPHDGPRRTGQRGPRSTERPAEPRGPLPTSPSPVRPRLRIVGDRLDRPGAAPCSRPPCATRARSTVQAAVAHGRSPTPVTRAPLPDDLLGTALLPLRVAGKTPGQLEVLAAAEQLVIGLRSAFPCDPRPSGMRASVLPGEGRLRRDCANLAEVLHRTHTDCPRRHHRLAAMAGAGCAGPVTGLGVRELADGTVRAVLERGGRSATPLGRLADGELRYLALALTLLTGPGVLAMDRIAEVPDAMQSLTLLADGLDRGLDGRQVRELLGLAVAIAADGHIRVAGTVGERGAGEARRTSGVTVVDLGV
ncbi:ATP-binding protein [Streptomyces narbonensis]